MSTSIVVASGRPGPVALALDGINLTVVVTGPTGLSYSSPGLFNTAKPGARALLDTGSTISSVDLSILQLVAAQQVGQVTISTVLGSSVAPVYNATIGLPLANAVLPLMNGLPGVLGDSLPGPERVLIGDDIMSNLILVRDGPAGSWSLSVPATTPVPIPQQSSNTAAVALGIGGIAVAAASGVALAVVARNEQRQIQGLRRELTQAEARRRGWGA